MRSGNIKLLDSIELLFRDAVNKLLFSLSYLKRKELIRILLQIAINDRIVDEKLEILVIVIDGTLSLTLLVKELIHRSNLRNIAVLKRLDLTPRLQEPDKHIIAFLSMLTHLALVSTLLAVLDEGNARLIFALHHGDCGIKFTIPLLD